MKYFVFFLAISGFTMPGISHAMGKRPPEPPFVEAPHTSATYSSLSKNVFIPKCVRCHGLKHADGFVVLDSWKDVLQEVKPGEPDRSSLWRAVRKDSMPRGRIPKLTPNQKDALYTWIKNGARNN